jgi:hypothetical protein
MKLAAVAMALAALAAVSTPRAVAAAPRSSFRA